jgi:type IV secretory pathway VirJ component
VSTYFLQHFRPQLALVASAFLLANAAIGADSVSPPPAPYKAGLLKSHKAGKPSSAAQDAKPKPPSHDPEATRIIDYPGLGEITIYAPQGDARGMALFASGDGGWNLGVWDMAQTAASLGYWVAGFSTPGFLKTLEASPGACSDAAGLLEQVSDSVKKEMKLPAAFRPVLIGYSSGATIAYAALAEAGDARFSGAMTLGFCPDLIIHRPWCEGAGGLTATKMPKPPYTPIFNTVPRVPAPWIVLQGEIDQVCNPPATVAFVDKVKNGKVISLPKVGHGFGVPRNWMPQYRQGLIELRDADATPRASTAGE